VGKFFLAIAVIAVAIYLVTRLIETRGHPFRRTPSTRRPLLPPRPQPGRPLGPDDDPEFLRDLNRRRKKHEDET
jgi:hypothetical protein